MRGTRGDRRQPPLIARIAYCAAKSAMQAKNSLRPSPGIHIISNNKAQEDRTMTIAAILKLKTGDVISVVPATRIVEVIAVLAEKRIGAVLVMDTVDQLLGILSERDVVRSLAANGTATLQMTAAQLMTPHPTTATPNISVADAMAIMTEGRFRHLPIVDGGKLVGLVSIGDVVKARITQQEHEVDSLRAYVSGAAA
jgi:CBS domain-containing protein